MSNTYKTIFVKMVVKSDDAQTVYDHLKKYITNLSISHFIEITIDRAINREKALVENISSTFEGKYPIESNVKICKKGLKQGPLIKRPEIEPGTKGKVIGIDSGSFQSFHIKFENGKTIYCSFDELEEA
jgi:hypothetical protein